MWNQLARYGNSAIDKIRRIYNQIPITWLPTRSDKEAKRYLKTEKVRSYLSAYGNIARFLPLIDTYTEETAEIRRMYRIMLRDPYVKAAMFTKVFSVASLDLQVNPASKENIDKDAAEWVQYALDHHLGGTEQLIYNILVHGLIDGFSVGEMVWDEVPRGKYKGRVYVQELKPKDSKFLILEGDSYRNITGVQDLRSANTYHPSNFAIWSHMPLYDSPTGMSDFRAAYRCYDDQTEVLTDNGWKLFSDVTDDDQVATLVDQKRLEFHKPSDRTNFHYKGKMFCQESTHVNVCVTPNHRMWVGTRQGRKFDFVDAEKLMDGSRSKCVRYKRNAEWIGEEKEFFTLPAVEFSQRTTRKDGNGVRYTTLPEQKLPMDDWLAFFGFWLAEGGTYRRKDGNRQCQVTLTQNPGPDLDEIIEVIKRLGFSYCITSKGDRKAKNVLIGGLQLWTYLSPFGKCRDKFIPKEIKNLSPRQLRILIDWMMRGDGRHNGTQYPTMSKQLADDMSEIILKAGYAPTTFQEKCDSKEGYIWITSKNVAGIDGSLVNEHQDNRSWKDYDGQVYCCTVPSGIIYVRRKGRSYWCGNSFWLIDAAWQLRAIAMERYGLPIMVGRYTDPGTQLDLESKLDELRSQSWITLPPEVQVEALNLAGATKESEFQAAINDLREEMAVAITGASLQMLQGQVADGRGDSQVHKSTSELIPWYLRSQIQAVIYNQIVPALVEYNLPGADYPTISLGSVSDTDLEATLRVDTGLQQLGWIHSKEEIQEKYGRRLPKDKGDELQPQQQQGMGMGGFPGMGGDMGGGMSPEGPDDDPNGGGGGDTDLASLLATGKFSEEQTRAILKFAERQRKYWRSPERDPKTNRYRYSKTKKRGWLPPNSEHAAEGIKPKSAERDDEPNGTQEERQPWENVTREEYARWQYEMAPYPNKPRFSWDDLLPSAKQDVIDMYGPDWDRLHQEKQAQDARKQKKDEPQDDRGARGARGASEEELNQEAIRLLDLAANGVNPRKNKAKAKELSRQADELRRGQWKKDSSKMSNKELGEYHDQLRERRRNESDDNLRDEIDAEIQKVRELARRQTNQRVQKQIASQSPPANKPDTRGEEKKDWKPGSTISVAGAKRKYIGYDPEQGGHIVENDQGDQWPLEEQELQIAKLIEPPSQKRPSTAHLLTQEQFVQSEKAKRVANANSQVQSALSQLEQTLKQQGVRLPVGISPRQYAAVEVGERKRPNKQIKEAFRNLERAERNAEIIRNDKRQEQLDARVHQQLVAKSQPKPPTPPSLSDYRAKRDQVAPVDLDANEDLPAEPEQRKQKPEKPEPQHVANTNDLISRLKDGDARRLDILQHVVNLSSGKDANQYKQLVQDITGKKARTTDEADEILHKHIAKEAGRPELFSEQDVKKKLIADDPANRDFTNAEQLLERAVRWGNKALSALVRRVIERNPTHPEFLQEDRNVMTEIIARVMAPANLLGQYRVRKLAEIAEKNLEKFSDQEVLKFAEPIQPMAPKNALEYFRSLVPAWNLEPNWTDNLRKRAFTMAVTSEQTILDRVRSIIDKSLALGQVDQDQPVVQIQSVLDEAGISPRNKNYSEMLFRTNMMQAYTQGSQQAMRDPKVADLFPVWRYTGIRDGRQGKDHEVHFGKYYPASVDFDSVRGPRPWNCRCNPVPVSKFKWKRLQQNGARLSV